MPVSMKYILQQKALVEQRVFKHCIVKVWKPFTVERGDKTYQLMDEFSDHLMTSCCHAVKKCSQRMWVRGGLHSRR